MATLELEEGSASARTARTPRVAALQIEAQGLLDYAYSLFDTGEEIMFTVDIPYVPVQDTPIVLVQAATPAAGSATPFPDYLLKMCTEVASSNASQAVMNRIDPAGWLAVELGNRAGVSIDQATRATIKITLLESATHGALDPKTSDSGRVSYTYSSKPGYLGKDEAVFLAEFQGKRYKVVVNLVVSKDLIENPLTSAMTPVCPEPQLIKLQKR